MGDTGKSKTNEEYVLQGPGSPVWVSYTCIGLLFQYPFKSSVPLLRSFTVMQTDFVSCKLTWDGERLLPQLGQGSTDMFGRDSVDKVKFKLFFYINVGILSPYWWLIYSILVTNFMDKKRLNLLKFCKAKMSTSSECHGGRLGTEIAAIPSSSKITETGTYSICEVI